MFTHVIVGSCEVCGGRLEFAEGVFTVWLPDVEDVVSMHLIVGSCEICGREAGVRGRCIPFGNTKKLMQVSSTCK